MLAKTREYKAVIAEIRNAEDRNIYFAGTMVIKYAIRESMTAFDKAMIDLSVEKKDLESQGCKDKEAIYDVVAEGLAKGYAWGSGEFGVGPKGTLYLKKPGYVRDLVMRGCSRILIQPGIPQWVTLKNRSYWAITGHGEMIHDGQPVSCKFTEEYPIGISGNATDGIANIVAKAERRIAQVLYGFVSTFAPDEDTEGEVIEIVSNSLPAITNDTAEPEITQLKRDRIAAEFELASCRKMIADNADHVAFFEESVLGVNESDSLELLNEVRKLMTDKNKTVKLSGRVTNELRRLVAIRERELSEVAQ